MAEPNVDLVRRALEAFARRDLDAIQGLLDDEMEFRAPTAEIAGRSSYRGPEGLRTYFADVASIWEELQVIPQEYKAIGDRVLVSGRVYARGKGGYVIDSATDWVWRVRDGKILWGAVFTDRDEALKAASEPG
jgi:ketosteroid isomerase-like protein